MASFSSRGGPQQTLGVSKPDITAPGVQILAGHTPKSVELATGPQGQLFQAIAGTSMSSPHIAGSAALIKSLRSTWTPGQIKSALMTTARTLVVKEDGSTPASAFDSGSGRVDLSKAGNPALTFDVTTTAYTLHQNDLWNVNYPSVYVPQLTGLLIVQRTAHNTLAVASRWGLSITGKSANDFAVSVPPQIIVPAGTDFAFNIVIDGSTVPVGQVRMATLELKQLDANTSRKLHIPITFVRAQPLVTRPTP